MTHATILEATESQGQARSLTTSERDAEVLIWLSSPVLQAGDYKSLVFDVLPLPAFIVDAGGTIHAANRAVAVAVGMTPASLLGRVAGELLASVGAQILGEGCSRQLLMTTNGPRLVTVQAVALPTNAETPLTLLLIDSEGKASQELAESYPQLLDVAHELRSPLHAFNLALGGLARATGELNNSDHALLVGALQRSSVHLQTLVENLLDAASLGANQFSLMTDAIDLSTVIRESVLIVDPLLAPKQQQIVANLPKKPVVIQGDAQRLRQVLVNLLHNAIKYGPRESKIKVRAKRDRGEIKVTVTDRGPGIPEDEQRRIFERYYRGRTAKKSGQGTGLGLSIAQAVILAHGGAIGVHTEPRGGTTFWFTLRGRD